MFYKYLGSFILALFFTACSTSNYVLYNYKTSSDDGTNVISFDFGKSEKKIELTKPKYENRFSDCSIDTYTLFDDNYEYGKLFIENIELENTCSWNGLPSGYFIYEFKNKFKSFKLVNRFLKSNYEVSTYLVDGEKYVDIIDIFSVNKNTFIIDSKGKLASLIISSLEADYEYKYLEEKRLDFDYDYSLVQNNFFKAYFGRESLSDERP